jgi:hypothetical protein
LPKPSGKKKVATAIVRRGSKNVTIPNWKTLTSIIERSTGIARIRPYKLAVIIAPAVKRVGALVSICATLSGITQENLNAEG